ncbi:MAG TPA: hypothetical protein VEY51_01965 [Chondromyces sp.]|nr:hypothetical protein [Chondromyces sp.]
MSKGIVIVFVLQLLLAAAGFIHLSKETNAEQTMNVREKKDEELIFYSVEAAENYVWQQVQRDDGFQKIEKILANHHHVDKGAYEKIRYGWYIKKEKYQERMTKLDAAGDKIMRYGHWKKYIQVKTKEMKVRRIEVISSKEPESLYGYETEFISVGNTYRLVKLSPLIN